jgi:murein DD-endopeptidase MepM/ murein hydrolase activator NlpD
MRAVSMPATEYVFLSNPHKNTKKYRINYADPEKSAELDQGWQFYDMTQNPPETFQSWTICYRQASNFQQLEVLYFMPANPYYIPGRYRIDCFVPDRHASVLEANFSIIHKMDEQGNPVEEKVTINFRAASNEWRSLGEYDLDVGNGQRIGTVRQFDISSQTNARRKPREISFGPIRWVPLYQTPEPLYVAANDLERCTTRYLDQDKAELLAQEWSTYTSYDYDDITKKWTTWAIRRRRRSTSRQIQVDYMPSLTQKGHYRVEAFIPSRTSSTQANYSIRTGVLSSDEKSLPVDQTKDRNQWITLGEVDFDGSPFPDSATDQVGRVSQFDDSKDSRNVPITFGPMRWLARFALELKPSQQFDFPIGDERERAARIVKDPSRPQLWLSHWEDSTPYLQDYWLGLHTGADLNLDNTEDRDEHIFAAGDGVVKFANKIKKGTWGNIIVIEHPQAKVHLPDGRIEHRKVYSRYGHVSPKSLELVEEGQSVLRGQHIGYIGLMGGATDGWHLHFDISPTETLLTDPDHWPVMTKLADLFKNKKQNTAEYRHEKIRISALVRQDYIDPWDFIFDNHNDFLQPSP